MQLHTSAQMLEADVASSSNYVPVVSCPKLSFCPFEPNDLSSWEAQRNNFIQKNITILLEIACITKTRIMRNVGLIWYLISFL